MTCHNRYKNIFRKNHTFQLIGISFVPPVVAFAIGLLVNLIVEMVHKSDFFYFFFGNISYIFILNLMFLVWSLTYWFMYMLIESNNLFTYNRSVEKNILMGITLFIISEVFLFISVFWAFFHSSLSPSIFIGSVWPPIGIAVINPWLIPFLNTIVLVTSGITVNCYYYSLNGLCFSISLFPYINFRFNNSYNVVSNLYVMIKNNKKNYFISLFLIKTAFLSNIKSYNSVKKLWKLVYIYLFLTVILGFFFLIAQFYEYVNLPFSLSDGIYGSTFYLSTGLHGLHVFLGLLMLSSCLNNLITGNYDKTPNIHILSTSSVWYWHFVDVVWLVLFIFVYIWSN